MKEYSFTINGHGYQVVVKSLKDANASVCVNGEDYEVVFTGQEEKSSSSEMASSTVAAVDTGTKGVSSAATGSAVGKKVTSPLPGILVELCVSTGQTVKAGQKVAVLEAMKMENDILAEYDGTVGQVFAAKGDSILEGAAIIEIV